MLDTIGRWTSGDEPNAFKGALAGAVGGFMGTLRMGRLSSLWNKANRKLEQSESPYLKPLAMRRQTEEDPLPPFGDATEARAEQTVAAGVVQSATGYELGQHDREIGGEIVHKLTGITIGAAYGAAVEYAPRLTTAGGLLLGAGTYLLGRQVALPLFHLSNNPKKQPTSDHLLGLFSHLVFGFFCETVRSRLRAVMEGD